MCPFVVRHAAGIVPGGNSHRLLNSQDHSLESEISHLYIGIAKTRQIMVNVEDKCW